MAPGGGGARVLARFAKILVYLELRCARDTNGEVKKLAIDAN